MNKMLVVWVSLAASMTGAPVGKAQADSNDCQQMLIANGIDFRGSAVCNPAWLDRPGSLTIADLSHAACNTKKGELPKSFDKFMRQGFIKFDSMVKESGKTSACAALDKMISDIAPDRVSGNQTEEEKANIMADDLGKHTGLKCHGKALKDGGVTMDCE
jgi:hypothetical protein